MATDDVVEFAMHLMRQTRATGMQATWEARVEVGRLIEIKDQGSNCVHLIPTTGRPATMQHLMEEWHSQVFRHAFVELPQILLTQVGRFKPDSRGRLRRRTMQIKPVFDAIMVPRFVDEGLHTCFVPYKPMAVICHEGKDPQ